MPPKRSSTRRPGTVSRSPDVHESPSYLPGSGLSSSATKNPALPDIPVKHSFNYGASSTPLLPRKLAAQGNIDLTEVAKTIDKSIETSQVREKVREKVRENSDSHPNTRSRNPSTTSLSPPRRNRRAPTPDQTQLFNSLREATISPAPPDPEIEATQSTPTPTPPIPHTLSTASSPATQTLTDPRYSALQADQLYPSPLQRLGSPGRDISLSSPQFDKSFDNESIISWTVERDIHGDDLQRTHGSRYREEPQGKNITAPPRRFSGLAFTQDTIKEEEEPESEFSVSKSPSPMPATTIQPKVDIVPELQPELQSESRSVSLSRSRSASIQVQPAISSAPAKTIISYRNIPDLSPRQSSPPPMRERSRSHMSEATSSTMASRKNIFIRIGTLMLVATMSCFTVYSFGDSILDFSSNIGSHLRWGSGMPPIDLDSTGLEAVHGLSNQVRRLGAQVSSLSRDVEVIRSELDNVAAAPTTIGERLPPPPKINFLSIGMGALIDPRRTSPAIGRTHKMLEKFSSWLLKTPLRNPLPPIAALTRWEDVGDCWCSARRDGMSQLAVLLGRPIVPEEVVIEHIPKGSTIRPEVAPAKMEMWAKFSVVKTDATLSDQSSPSQPRPKSPLSEGFSLHEVVMNTLRVAYLGVAPSAYSGDPYLGSSFYRVGQWKYDIHGPSHIQHFQLDAIIDIPGIRVDYVVFRIKSNWGANETCLYRVKLHGHT
ncbi:hypothetical protein FE257_011645 [Aspergillus nanangensis]|uniref:SUN domain-containing protein n=1 Tax=Aspergillus nanangensis TaxID=2582783 RepID=A0AAD4CWX4_ASPNN|nr:hypothetical protein FE257_011645 [Aspergillus nanangensis]